MEILIAILISAAAVAAVLYPIVGTTRRRIGTRAAVGHAELDAEVSAYREALRAGTACARCGLANPAGSRFCAECGRRIEPRGRKG